MASLASRSAAVQAWWKLLAGDLGLPVTFWVFYFGVPLAWDLGVQVLSSIALFRSPAVYALLQIALLIYVVPVTVGVFRAANKYKGRQPIWALYAKAFSVLGIIALALVVVTLIKAS